jgi:cobalt transporter subunit CbtA
MIGRIVLAALVAGLLAGLVMAGIQFTRLTPLIQLAEIYETADDPNADPARAAIAQAAKPCVETMPGMKMCGDEPVWQPTEGWQRTLSTSVTLILTGIGFAAMLVGISMIINVPITKQNGLIWGLCGFLAVAVSPAAGLPPELPGMPVADLMPRQIWWAGTIAATAVAIYLITIRPEPWAKLTGIILIALPHLLGAPLPPNTVSTVPPVLAAEFVANSIAAAAIFWSLIGFFLGHALNRYQKDIAEL